MITVRSDDGYLTFEQDGREFYDSAIPCEADIGRWFRHMDDKNWFYEVRLLCLGLIREHHATQ